MLFLLKTKKNTMNSIFRFILLLSFLFFNSKNISAQTENSNLDSYQNQNNLSVFEMAVSGMYCPMGCARALEVELNKIDGVNSAKVDFDNSSAELSFDPLVISEASILSFVNNYREGSFSAKKILKKNCNPSECDKPDCCKKVEKKQVKAGCQKSCCSGKK